jgi:hypothetical protein
MRQLSLIFTKSLSLNGLVYVQRPIDTQISTRVKKVSVLQH